MKIATHLPHGHRHTKQWTYIWWCLSGSRSRIWGLISPSSLVHQVCENMLLMDTHTRATFLDPHTQFQMFDMQIRWFAMLCVSVHSKNRCYFTSLPTPPLLSSKSKILSSTLIWTRIWCLSVFNDGVHKSMWHLTLSLNQHLIFYLRVLSATVVGSGS